jgi:hypothetical protein
MRRGGRSLTGFGIAALFTLLATLSASLLSASAAAADATTSTYLASLAGRLPAKATATLQQIQGEDRQLLAVRAYLRAGGDLNSRWSWSSEEIRARTQTPEHRELLAAIDQVRRRFEAQNPGYSLYANIEPRSLELQLERWNSNRSVGATARALQQAATAELRNGGYAAEPDKASVDRFAKFLAQWRPPIAAALAAPGLSRHGQLRAIDFQIMKGGAVVAGTEVASARRTWDAQGWTKKLNAATIGSRFVGPLQSPHEPWHYEYAP